MNHISEENLQRANIEAIYNIYLYLVHKATPPGGEPLLLAVTKLESAYVNDASEWSERDTYRLRILKNAVEQNRILAASSIELMTHIPGGLTVCIFKRPDGSISTVFKGSGNGEWTDNGIGLSGIPEQNTYITYAAGGEELYRYTVEKDYATDRQVEALNWFNRAAAKMGWNEFSDITVSGHSKGGNKAQFVTLHSTLADRCFSFDGQGFSPEALASFKEKLGTKYEMSREHIISISAENDYVNVLGERLAPKGQIYYFKSGDGIHFMEALLDKNGKLRAQCEQGLLSVYAENISKELMSIRPEIRQYATVGAMKLLQNK